MTRLLAFAAMLLLALAACAPQPAAIVAPSPSPRPTATERVIPTPVVIVVTATPTTAAPASPAPATPVPTPTLPVPPTNTPAPTPTPIVIIITATPTNTVGPTPTRTPSPTATPHPAQVQTFSGSGGKITDVFNLLGGRPVRIHVEADDDPHFGVYLRFTNSCIRQLTEGGQVYWRDPSSNVCTNHILPARSVRLEVIARADTDWSVDFDMAYAPTQIFPPQTFTGTGSGYMPAIVIGESNVIELDWSGGAASLDFMRLYQGDGLVVNGIASAASGGHQERVFGAEPQTYMPYVTATPGVEWTVKVR